MARSLDRTRSESENPNIPSLSLSLWDFRDAAACRDASPALVNDVEKLRQIYFKGPKARVSRIGALRRWFGSDTA